MGTSNGTISAIKRDFDSEENNLEDYQGHENFRRQRLAIVLGAVFGSLAGVGLIAGISVLVYCKCFKKK